MKRIFTIILSALLAVTFTTASAQQNIFIWKKGGKIAVKSAANVDSLTFKLGSWLFKIYTSAATSVTTEKFEATAHISFNDNVKSLSNDPEVGVCFSSENEVPTYDTAERKRLGTSVKDYDFTIYELDPGTTYYYRTYVKLGDEVIYGNVESITTFGEKPKTPTILINGHKFVDLGLPSGLLWAMINVGASSSTDDGDYFAWGEVETKSYYDWDTYKWSSSSSSISKYNSRDGKVTLDAEDDVATVQWGHGCRMPSCEEFKELYNKCKWSWKSDYNGTGVNGYLVTGPNSNTIFFPASSYRIQDRLDLFDRGSRGHYWSSSLESFFTSSNYSYYLYFDNEYIYPCYSFNARYCGKPVRPVAEK